MESREQRFRLLRQGRQAPRASLQNSSPPQSSSSVQTADCYSEKIRNTCSGISNVRVSVWNAPTATLRTVRNFTHGKHSHLRSVCGSFVSHAAGGWCPRSGADRDDAFARRSSGQILNGVGVHLHGPRANVSKVSKEGEVHSQKAMRWRQRHVRSVLLQRTEKRLLSGRKWRSDKVQIAVESRICESWLAAQDGLEISCLRS